jgi:hypothetical protein
MACLRPRRQPRQPLVNEPVAGNRHHDRQATGSLTLASCALGRSYGPVGGFSGRLGITHTSKLVRAVSGCPRSGQRLARKTPSLVRNLLISAPPRQLLHSSFVRSRDPQDHVAVALARPRRARSLLTTSAANQAPRRALFVPPRTLPSLAAWWRGSRRRLRSLASRTAPPPRPDARTRSPNAPRLAPVISVTAMKPGQKSRRSSANPDHSAPASASASTMTPTVRLSFNYCTQRTMALTLSFTAAKPVCNRVCERARLESR